MTDNVRTAHERTMQLTAAAIAAPRRDGRRKIGVVRPLSRRRPSLIVTLLVLDLVVLFVGAAALVWRFAS